MTEDALLPVGTQITVRHFIPGQYVDVTGITRGKGFQVSDACLLLQSYDLSCLKRLAYGIDPLSTILFSSMYVLNCFMMTYLESLILAYVNPNYYFHTIEIAKYEFVLNTCGTFQCLTIIFS